MISIINEWVYKCIHKYTVYTYSIYLSLSLYMSSARLPGSGFFITMWAVQ